MRKQRAQFQRMRETIKIAEYTPKTLAKRNPNLPRNDQSLQKSAHQRTRKLGRSILLSQPVSAALVDQDVRNSHMFRIMEEEMKLMTAKHQTEMARLREIKEVRERQLKGVQQQQYATKMEIWQLRNQSLSLKEGIEEQKEEIERLQRDLGMMQVQQQPS